METIQSISKTSKKHGKTCNTVEKIIRTRFKQLDYPTQQWFLQVVEKPPYWDQQHYYIQFQQEEMTKQKQQLKQKDIEMEQLTQQQPTPKKDKNKNKEKGKDKNKDNNKQDDQKQNDPNQLMQPIPLDQLHQLLYGNRQQFVNNQNLSQFMPRQQQSNNNGNINNNTDNKKRSDGNVSQIPQQQRAQAEHAIRQARLATLYYKQQQGTATVADSTYAYAPIPLGEVQAYIAATTIMSQQQEEKTTNVAQQAQNQWTAQQLPQLQAQQQQPTQTTTQFQNPKSKNEFVQQLGALLGGDTMPSSQVVGALPANPTGMIQTPVNPNLEPQLRNLAAMNNMSTTNLTPQAKQQILQILQSQQQGGTTTTTNTGQIPAPPRESAVDLLGTSQASNTSLVITP